MPQRHKEQPRPLTLKGARRLDAIEELMDAARWDEASRKLRDFTTRNPNVVEGWLVTLDLAASTGDNFLSWQAARRLAELDPHHEAHFYSAAVTSAQLSLPFTALHYLDTYLERWPEGAYSRDARKLHKMVAAFCDELLEQYPIAEGTDPAALRLFEAGQILVSYGEHKEGRALSQQAARLLPGFPPPHNNVALSYVVEGRLERALPLSQKVLADHPHNIHARCNTAQILIRLGRADEAQPLLDGLRDEQPTVPELWRKIMETFAHAGDDRAVVEVYKRARKKLGRKRRLEAMAHHLAAVAHARSGDLKQARRLWKRALDEDPQLELARDNLADSRLPPGQQNGAWYLPVTHWLPKAWLERLMRLFERAGQRGDDADYVRRGLQRAFETFPGLEASLSLMLEQGDSLSVEAALNIAGHVPLPGLVEFALGRRGSDDNRMKAANLAVRHGLLDASQPVTLYVEGQPRELRLLGFEIHHDYQPPADLPDPALSLLEATTEALYDDRPVEALGLVEQALELAPDHPILLNQKAVALTNLGRHQEAEVIIRRNARLHPDYLFARCAMAQLLLREDKLDEAQEWLDGLLDRTRFHVSEFTALATAQVALLLKRGELEGAMSWVDMWSGVDPDSVPSLWSAFSRLLKKKDLSELELQEAVQELLGSDALAILDALLDGGGPEGG